MGNVISGTIDGSSIDTSVVADTDFGVELGTSNVPANPVSYTHLDVYKRQVRHSDCDRDRKRKLCGKRNGTVYHRKPRYCGGGCDGGSDSESGIHLSLIHI